MTNETNNALKGGRGKKASYKTTHAKIPVALKLVVWQMISEYRRLVFSEVIPPSQVNRTIRCAYVAFGDKADELTKRFDLKGDVNELIEEQEGDRDEF